MVSYWRDSLNWRIIEFNFLRPLFLIKVPPIHNTITMLSLVLHLPLPPVLSLTPGDIWIFLVALILVRSSLLQVIGIFAKLPLALSLALSFALCVSLIIVVTLLPSFVIAFYLVLNCGRVILSNVVSRERLVITCSLVRVWRVNDRNWS